MSFIFVLGDVRDTSAAGPRPCCSSFIPFATVSWMHLLILLYCWFCTVVLRVVTYTGKSDANVMITKNNYVS